MLTIIRNYSEAMQRFGVIQRRSLQDAARVRNEVYAMMEDIFQRFEPAVNDIAMRFDNVPPREIPREDWETAFSACDPVLLEDLRLAARNIEDYQKRLLPRGGTWKNPDGGGVGVLLRPLKRAGIYVPGGTSAYPSSVLMTAIPARVAGVGEIIMCTPPGEMLKPEVLAAASICGVDRVFAIGGVPAIASMALGIGLIPGCDVVAGPGNAYVTEAKRQIFGHCGIDSTAGPSDIMIICDRTANPAWVAADLLSQAEHGAHSGAVLVTTDEAAARAVCAELERQIVTLPRRKEAEAALHGYSAAVVLSSQEEALDIVNLFAPEHLEIITADADTWLDGVQNAGAVFIGPYSPEPLGDYWAGPSHVLPTEGHARFFSPVSVDIFLKRTSILAYDRETFLPVSGSIARLARAEGLEAHARSAEIRN